jgi:hypothetical protein
MAKHQAKWHLRDANNGRKLREYIMTALTRSLSEIGAALGVVGAAISSAAAMRINRRPEGAVRFPDQDHSVRI